MNFAYSLFVAILITMKIIYTIVSIYLFINKNNSFTEKYQKLNIFNEKLLLVSEVGLFVLLLIVFFPFSNKEIIITFHEQILFFFLGIVGLLHIDYGFLLNKNQLNQ